MPYEISTTGMDDLAAKLKMAEDRAEGVAARALYIGAGIVADAITKEAQTIKTEPFKFATGGEKRLPSPEEKAALLEEGPAGIAKFDKLGFEVNTNVGYGRAGYAKVKFSHMRWNGRTNYKVNTDERTTQDAVWSGKAHLIKGENGRAKRLKRAAGENAKPIAVLANAINSGTSFMVKDPFIRRAINKSQKAAIAAIDAEITRIVEDMLKD